MSNLSDYPTPTSPEPNAVVLSEDVEVTTSQRISAGIDVDQQQPEPAHHSLPLQNPVDPHLSNWFQKMFEQFQHLLEASTVFKTEEEKLQQLLTSVRNIVGPRVAKWIDEDVAASMEAGKLICRDLFQLDVEFKGSNDDDDLLKSKSGGSEERDEHASRINSDRKGKGKGKDNDGPSQDSSNDGRIGDNTKTSGSQTRSNRRKRSVESQSDESDDNTDRQKRFKISPVVSSESPPVPEKPSSPLKRVRQEVEDNAIGSEDEVEKSITMFRSFSSVLEDSGPVSKKPRYQANHVFDIDVSNDSFGINSHRLTRFSADNHAGPSTTTNHLFPPSAFPGVKPSPAPTKLHERSARPLQRDTMRVRANSVTGALEVFDYESTPDYRERLQREQYCNFLQPTVCDTKADLEAMIELEGPRFKFNRDAWQDFEDHTLVSESD